MKTVPAFMCVCVLVALSSILQGCGKQEAKSTPTGATSTASAAVLPAGLFLAAEPANAKPLEDAKHGAKPGETIVARGRIGGSEDPFVHGRAVFTIIGPNLKACSDNPGDMCKTPWDYCCESKTDIAAHAATVQIVDANGAPVKVEFKGQNGVKELSDLIVVGTVARADGNVLVVNATGIYVASK